MQVDLVLELVLICSKSTSAVVVRLNIDSLIRDSYSNCRQLGTTVIGTTITDVDVDVHEAVISLGAVSRLSVVREKKNDERVLRYSGTIIKAGYRSKGTQYATVPSMHTIKEASGDMSMCANCYRCGREHRPPKQASLGYATMFLSPFCRKKGVFGCRRDGKRVETKEAKEMGCFRSWR
jgi:hypothetical protein